MEVKMSLKISKLTLGLLTLLIIANISYSQSAWTLQYQTDTSVVLGPIAFVNSNIGFCTYFDSYLKTTNSGANWILRQLDSSFEISQYLFLNESDYLAIANQKNIIKTTNGGLNWHKVLSINNFLYRIYAVDSLVIYAVGSNATFYQSTDGGN